MKPVAAVQLSTLETRLRLIDQVSDLCKELGFDDAYRFARSLQRPSVAQALEQSNGVPDTKLIFRLDHACEQTSAAIRRRHSMTGSETEHVMLFRWAALVAQNFRSIPTLPGSIPRQSAKHSSDQNSAMRDVEVSRSIDSWMHRINTGDHVMSAAVMLHLASRPDLRARLRSAKLEDEVFDAIIETFPRSQPLSSERVLAWCEAIRKTCLKDGRHTHHAGLVIVADTARKAFLRFTGRKGGPDSGASEKGFKAATYMGWSFDIACFVFPDLSDHEGASTWKSVNRHVEANPNDADQLLVDNGIKQLRRLCLPWLP